MTDLSVPKDLEERMRRFPEVNWSVVVRRAVSEKLEKLAFMKYFASESDMTEEDAVELGSKLNQGLAKRYKGA